MYLSLSWCAVAWTYFIDSRIIHIVEYKSDTQFVFKGSWVKQTKERRKTTTKNTKTKRKGNTIHKRKLYIYNRTFVVPESRDEKRNSFSGKIKAVEERIEAKRILFSTHTIRYDSIWLDSERHWHHTGEVKSKRKEKAYNKSYRIVSYRLPS